MAVWFHIDNQNSALPWPLGASAENQLPHNFYMQKQTCYMCDDLATSQEHAPPKCIFPEQKDTGGVDYRRNLIKVPSCDLHNTAKSTEDEYMMYILPASIATNNVGINQFLTKIKRAIARNPNIASGLTRDIREVAVHDVDTDIWTKATAVQIDLTRIHSVVEMNARAIYFHERKQKFSGKITVVSNFTLKLDDPEINELRDQLFAMSEILLSEAVPQGENPDVFAYKMARDGNTEIVEFTFYGTSKALAVLAH
jgi:hypothetical protein